MKRITLYVIVLAACAVSAHAGATKEQKETAKRAFHLYPSPFIVPANVSDLAWDRASEWIAAVPDRPIELDSKHTIQTYRSYDSSSMAMSCGVKRRKIVDGVSLTASCNINNPFAAGEARRSEVMFRRYVLTGDEACIHSGERWKDAIRCLLDCDAGGGCEPRANDPDFPEIPIEEPTVVGGCTLEQITTMAASGLTKEQIQAACGDDY